MMEKLDLESIAEMLKGRCETREIEGDDRGSRGIRMDADSLLEIALVLVNTAIGLEDRLSTLEHESNHRAELESEGEW